LASYVIWPHVRLQPRDSWTPRYDIRLSDPVIDDYIGIRLAATPMALRPAANLSHDLCLMQPRQDRWRLKLRRFPSRIGRSFKYVDGRWSSFARSVAAAGQASRDNILGAATPPANTSGRGHAAGVCSLACHPMTPGLRPCRKPPSGVCSRQILCGGL